MPTYGYECRSCEYTFDAFQSMSDEPLKTCPKCGESGLRRLINGGTGVIFKGGGFYVTDKNGKAGKSGKAGDSSKTTETKTAGADSAPCPGCAASESSACPKAVNS